MKLSDDEMVRSKRAFIQNLPDSVALSYYEIETIIEAVAATIEPSAREADLERMLDVCRDNPREEDAERIAKLEAVRRYIKAHHWRCPEHGTEAHLSSLLIRWRDPAFGQMSPLECATELEAALAQQAQPEMPTREQIEALRIHPPDATWDGVSAPNKRYNDALDDVLALFRAEANP
jgi:hypothetical protein